LIFARTFFITAAISFALFFCNTLFANPDSLKTNKPKLAAFPVLFFSPDTKLGGGAAGLFTFNFKSDSLNAQRSSINFGIVYTQLKQVLIYLPFQLFLKNKKYWIYGEIGYYKYVFNYFGTGNSVPHEYIEKYDAVYPRIRLNALHKLKQNIYCGVRYVYDDFKIDHRDSSGLLLTEKPIGYNGGRVSGLGVLVNYDSRNSIFFPSNGFLMETMFYAERGFTGSDFNYNRFSIDASNYFSVFKKHVLAINGAAIFLNGAVPFHQMAMLGGTKRLRGYFEGKYRGTNLVLAQAEYRAPLFWRIGLVAFAGAGMVAEKVSQLSTANLRYNCGAGLRLQLDKKRKINIRIDYGLGYQSTGFYLTIGEAF
jgi:outer membrane protein assembly factor BamA